MEESCSFVNETYYSQEALSAMNRFAEATVRREKSRRTRTLCYILGVMLLAAGGYFYSGYTMVGSILLLYGVILLLGGLYWKKLQLWTSQRLIHQGMRQCTYRFAEEGFACVTETMTDVFRYDQIMAVVCDRDWYVLFFDQGHGVILDRKGFIQGEERDFKMFIGMHTQLPIQEM